MSHPKRSSLFALLLVGGFLPLAPLRAAESADYLATVKPLLTARCYACHGALQQKGGLRLDTAALIRKGGDSGPAVIPGKAAESRLIAHVTATGGARRMPPPSEGEHLKAAEVNLLRAWIEQGARGPADEKPESDPKDHWAFRAPVRPTPPKVSNTAWARNPIDAFLAAEHDKRGLKPQPPAGRRLLLRRVYLDLVGLPPTLAEQEAFLADTSPAAYEKVVDRLLASPQYGERWGRHWMDVWRYSDWWGLGAEVRNSQKHIWHWRDWIIESLAADKGYEQMLREMLAADELYPEDADRLRAGGFLARHYFKFNRNTWLEEAVEHTSKAFLGLTMNCAKCHDHKYDPLLQQDFYRFRAFFEPYQLRTDMVRGETDFEKDGIPRAFDCNLDAPTYLFVRGDEKQPRTSKPLAPGLPRLLSFADLTIRSVNLPATVHTPGLRSEVLETHLHAAERQIAVARAALDQARKTRVNVAVAENALAAALLQPDLIRARAAADRARIDKPDAEARDLARAAAKREREAAVAAAEEALARAEQETVKAPDRTKAAAKKKAAEDALAAARKALEKPGETYASLRGALKTLESNVESEPSRNRPFPRRSTGRRSALAGWMTDGRNPLVARVAVNHIWARHFGKPLVATVFDFGRKGSPPTHPELLDWLAVELRENGWSMKHLHRLIVTSNAYRMTSSSAAASTGNRQSDPENRYYWRMNSLRMEAQVIRDSLLHLAGELDFTLGGPPVPVRDETSRRRSLYFFHSHNEQQKFLSIFDDASVLECYRRAESVLPQQALALENSRLALDVSEKVARRLEGLSDSDFIRTAFTLVLGCAPSAEEQRECEQALEELQDLATREKRPGARMRARSTLVGALLNHNDFVTIR